MNILERVLRVVEQHASRPFLIDGFNDRVYAYLDLHQLASNLAAELSARGIRRGDRVALVLMNSPELALLYFGCLYLGAVAVPVNPALHPREINFILRHSGVKLVVDSTQTANLFDRAELAGKGIRFWRVLTAGGHDQTSADGEDTWSLRTRLAALPDDWRPFTDASPDDLFSITFTSGTTSLPKGVAHRTGSLLENAAAFDERVGVSRHDCFLHVLPMTYMAGFLNTLLCPFMAGASVVLTQPFDAKVAMRFWEPVIRYKADTFWLTPTMLATLMHVDRSPAGREYCSRYVKSIFVGTAPLPQKIKKDFERKYEVELCESYGLSELLFVSVNSGCSHRAEGSVGRALPGVETRILNERGEIVPEGEDGEISIKTPYAMAGYLKCDVLEPEVINRNGWFATGDVGHLGADGQLFITGRKKDLIIRGGINISPAGVEDVLLDHPAIEQVSVIGLPHEFYGEEVVAVVKFKAGHTLAEERLSLDAFCKERLAAASVPTRFMEVSIFPRSTTGKVQKETLRKQLIAD